MALLRAHGLEIGLLLLVLTFGVETFFASRVASDLGAAMEPAVVEAELDEEVAHSLLKVAKRGDAVDMGWEMGTDGEVRRKLGPDKVEGDLDGAAGLADAAHAGLLLSKLTPVFLILKLAGVLLVLLWLLVWNRKRVTHSALAGLAAIAVLATVMSDSSGWFNAQLLSTQFALMAFDRYDNTVDQLEPARLEQGSFMDEGDSAAALPPSYRYDDPGLGSVQDAVRQSEQARRDLKWEIQDAWFAVVDASFQHDGALMMGWLAPATVTRLEQILAAAKATGPRSLEGLNTWERGMALMLRAQRTADALNQLSTSDALGIMMEKGYWLGSLFSGYMGDITEGDPGDRTVVFEMERSGREPVQVTAIKSGDSWKFDLRNVIADQSAVLKEQAIGENKGLDSLLLEIVKNSAPFDRKVPDSIVDGPLQEFESKW